MAPEALNTLQELAAAIGDDPTYFTTIANQVSELNTDVTDVVAALGIAENDSNVGTFTSPTLPDGVTLRAVLEAFASAHDTTKSNLETADSNLSGRLDALEADPTTQAYVDAQLSALIDSAPGVLDTLNELAAAIGDDADFIGTMNAANTALSNRLDTLEVDPTTQTYVDGIQTALDGRLDTLEADPTTATAVAAVQADVDQNEADADAALALKAPLADPDFTGVLEVDTNARLEFDSNLTKLHNVLRGTSINIGNNIELRPAAAGGRVEITGDLLLDASDLVNANNDTDAGNAGTPVGGVYHHNGVLRIRLS